MDRLTNKRKIIKLEVPLRKGKVDAIIDTIYTRSVPTK